MSIFSIGAICVVVFLYALVAVCLLKGGLKDVYKRTTLKEKILSIMILIGSLGAMMLFAARQEAQPVILGLLSKEIMGVLACVFYGNIQIMTLAVYIVCAMPVVLLSVLLLEKVSLKYRCLELPIYYYLLFFQINIMFYHPIRVSISGWFIALIVSCFLYGTVDLAQNGKDRKKIILMGMLICLLVLLIVVEQGLETKLILEYTWSVVESFVMAFGINRSAVLRKTLWCSVTIICYLIIFFGHIGIRM